jgi:hypothetical protein
MGHLLLLIDAIGLVLIAAPSVSLEEGAIKR